MGMGVTTVGLGETRADEVMGTAAREGNLMAVAIGMILVVAAMAAVYFIARSMSAKRNASGGPRDGEAPDAFATRAQQTPVRAGGTDTFATRAQDRPVSPIGTMAGEDDTFATRAAGRGSSPDAEDAFVTRARERSWADSEEPAGEEDAFATRAGRSRPQEEDDPFATRARGTSEPAVENPDPYAIRSHESSPAADAGEDDPFATRARSMAEQPVEEDLFSTRRQAPAAGRGAGEEPGEDDPFATRARRPAEEAPTDSEARTAADSQAEVAAATEFATEALRPAAKAPHAIALRFVVIEGPHQGEEFTVIGTAHLGRSPENEVPLVRDTAASRQHAVVTEDRGFFLVRDLGSSNGTYLNGNQIAESVLQPGDRIRIGRSELRVDR